MTAKYPPKLDPIVVTVGEVKRFMLDCVLALGASKYQADTVSDAILEADLKGHYSHGLYNFEKFIRDGKSGVCDIKNLPKVLKETDAVAWVDGQNAYGPVVGVFCMELAMKKAKVTGIGFVTAKRSNNYGCAGYYTDLAAKEGLIALSFSNSSPNLVPVRGKDPILGSNPIAFSAKGVNGDGIHLDMASSVTAMGKIELAARREDFIPVGWAMNAAGMIETDAHIAYKSGRLMPLGEFECHTGHKGTGLSMMAEIFSGILAGGFYGPSIKTWSERVSFYESQLAHCFIAIDPNAFGDSSGFKNRVSELLKYVRDQEPIDPLKPVLIPGDKMKEVRREHEKRGGIVYTLDLINTLNVIAVDLKVKPIQPKPKPPEHLYSGDEAEEGEGDEDIAQDFDQLEDELMHGKNASASNVPNMNFLKKLAEDEEDEEMKVEVELKVSEYDKMREKKA